MNREDIIRMARQAQLVYGSDEKPLESVIRFAALVAEHECNACAQVVEAIDRNGAWVTKEEAAAAIRKRGENGSKNG
jgi:hypothetical protein